MGSHFIFPSSCREQQLAWSSREWLHAEILQVNGKSGCLEATFSEVFTEIQPARLLEQLHEAGSSLHGCLHPAQGYEPQMCGYGGQRWNPKNWGKIPGFQCITHRRRSAERGSWELTALGSSWAKQTLLTLPSKLVTPSQTSQG